MSPSAAEREAARAFLVVACPHAFAAFLSRSRSKRLEVTSVELVPDNPCEGVQP